MLKREEALQLLKENIRDEKLMKHMLAVEAIMMECARFIGEDEDKWGLVGLLHDIDFERIEHPKEHGIIACEILKGRIEEEILKAIKSHNFENTKVMPNSKMEYCLIAADAISGLIIACALVMPSKKLKEVRVDSINRKFKQKDFARNCSRERMLYCERAGIPTDKFFEISLRALQEIAEDLGL